MRTAAAQGYAYESGKRRRARQRLVVLGRRINKARRLFYPVASVPEGRERVCKLPPFHGNLSHILFLEKGTARMPATKPKAIPAASETTVLTKAVLRAAQHLGMTNKSLATVIGVSEATVSRMRSGDYTLQRGQKSFELAALFLRFYRSLDAIVGGDQAVARAWLKNPNTALDSEPLTLIETVFGLINVIHYLDARRAIV
jgi:uncharacterized protein (DUF2384 family)